MNWDEIVERQSKDYAAHIEAVKKHREQLVAGKQSILATAKCSEADLPEPLKNMLQRDAETFEQQYGMYGSKFKEMRTNHQRELTKFFEHENVVKDLSKPNDKSKDRSGGR